MIRWALDLHRIPYIDKVNQAEDEWDVERCRQKKPTSSPSASSIPTFCYAKSIPWGFHLWESLEYSDDQPGGKQQVNVPIFISSRNEIMKELPEKILLYLYSKAFDTLRIYPKEECLDLQLYFDDHLGPAGRVIFLDTVLSNSTLAYKYLIDTTHLNTWKTLMRLTFPIIKMALKFHYKINNIDTVADAWLKVAEVFEKVEKLLEKRRKKEDYLVGDTFTAADLSFASHTIHILFPNESQDPYAEKMYIKTPSLTELRSDVARRVQALRAHPAGQYAIRLHKKERKNSYRKEESKYVAENNPWWSDFDVVVKTLCSMIISSSLALFASSRTFSMHYIVFAIFLILAGGAISFVMSPPESKLWKLQNKLGQLRAAYTVTPSVKKT